MQHAGPLPPPPTTMPPNAAPHHERFFPTANNPPASVMLPAVLTYLVVVPVVSVLFAAMAGGQGPHRGNVGIFVGFAAFALITPGVVFGLVGTALGRSASGCRVDTKALTIVIDRGNRVIPLGQIERAEVLPRRHVVEDKSLRSVMGFLNLEGEFNHGRFGRLYINLAGGSTTLNDDAPVVRVLLADGTSVVVDPFEAGELVECLQAVLATGKLPEAPLTFECTRMPSLVHQHRVEVLNRYLPVAFQVFGAVAFFAGMIGWFWPLAIIGAGMFVLVALALDEQRHHPLETLKGAYAVAINKTELLLRCLGGTRRFSLRDVAGVERLEYYDFWAETAVTHEGPARRFYFRHSYTPLAGTFHHPKHGRGYVNWRRLLPIDERAQPLVALRLKDKSLVVVDVDDPDALEAKLRQRLASLPAPVDLPGGRPE